MGVSLEIVTQEVQYFLNIFKLPHLNFNIRTYDVRLESLVMDICCVILLL